MAVKNEDSLKKLALNRIIAGIIADQLENECGYEVDRAELDRLFDGLDSEIKAGRDIYKKGGC